MDQVAQVREKTDIVSLLSEYLPLKQTGRNFKANCPFHQEKTASFVVSPERQIWHCFGCGKGGDVFSFLMEYEKLEFPEALSFLAKRVGIHLVERDKFQTKQSSQKEQVYTINHLAAEFYHYILTKHQAGKAAYDYLTKKRQLDPKLIETFLIGFAPNKQTALTDFLITKKKYQNQDLLTAGLASGYGKTLKDFFNNRIIFPLIDQRENIVGFSGRTLSEDSNVPKYINTKETLVYHKGSHFFGLNITKREIQRQNQAIVVEGEFDVMACFQNGISNVVAIKGTALTEAQAVMLKRFCSKVSLALDADLAGQEAIIRSLPIIEAQGLTLTVIPMPGGKDPDEALKADPYAFKKGVKADVDVYEYLLSQTLSKNNIASAEGKLAVSSLLLPLYGGIQNAIVREHYLRKLSTALDTSFESLEKELNKLKKPKSLNSKANEPVQNLPQSRQAKLETYLLALIIQSRFDLLPDLLTSLKTYKFTNNPYQRIFDTLREIIAKSKSVKDSSSAFAAEVMPTFDTLYLQSLPNFGDKQSYLAEIQKTIRALYTYALQKRLSLISAKMKQTQNEEELQKLQEAFSSATTQLLRLSKKEKL